MHIETRGARIWVHQQGDGPAVLLVGGLGDPADSWAAQIDAFSDRYRVVAPDNRGAGRSVLPPSGVSIPAMAEDAAEVLRSLEIQHAHVAGFSMGGAVAQELAINHPALVRSLVLSGTWTVPTSTGAGCSRAG
jgi:pimeloyl-ACP methyl ester carboxylesterase